jgi:hypothetical protein
VVAAVTMVTATLAVAPRASAAPLLASQTKVAGYPFFGPHRPNDLHVILVAEVSPLVLGVGLVTHPTVTFEVGLPDSEPFSKTVPIGLCVNPPGGCSTSTDFHADVECDPNDPGIWVKATFSGETLAPPLNLAISGPSTSAVYVISRCPTMSF